MRRAVTINTQRVCVSFGYVHALDYSTSLLASWLE